MNPSEKQDEKSGEEAIRSSRFGKEAKIGVAVLFVLLMALVAAVVVRLKGTNSEENLALAADRDSAGQKPAAAMKNDPFDHFRPKGSTAAPPTIVPAKAASAQPPKVVEGDLTRGKFTANKLRSASDAKPSLASDLPSPPAPPKASAGNRYDRYASASSLEPSPGSSAGRSHSAAGNAQLLAPSPQPRTRSTDRYSDSLAASDASRMVEPSGHAASGSEPPPPVPTYRDRSRSDPMASLPPPPPSRPGSSYAEEESYVPAAPTSPSNDDGYRRRSNDAVYGGAGMRRMPASSSYGNPPPRRDDGKYEVQPNDSYWTISEKLYGTGAYFKALVQHNQGKGMDEERLQPGQLVLAPSVTELEKAYPDLCPKPNRRETLQNRTSMVSTRPRHRTGRTYTVAEGDTLFNIARYELGKASRWVEIYELNRDVLGKDFNYLTPGTQLSLPEGDRGEVIAQPPSNDYRR